MRFATILIELGGSRKVVYAGIGAGVAVAIAAIVGMMGLPQGTGDAQQNNLSPVRDAPRTPQTASSGQELNVASLIASGAPFKGDPDAEVVLVDFSDFQCTNCRRFATQTEPQIVQDYVEAGKVVLVFKHFPVFGPDSVTAAMASMCAHDQGKFWEFHDHLYANQGFENSGWANSDNMKKFASEVDLDREQFDACLDGEKYREYVEGDLDFALGLRLPGTPSFVVMNSDGSDPEGMVGAQPYSSFKTVINGKLT